MKILLIAINYEPEPTGIGPYVASLARNLLARGHDVRVLTGVPHYPSWTTAAEATPWRSDEVIDGVPVRRLRHFVPRGGIGARRVLMELTFGAQVMTTRWGRPDLVLTVSPPLIPSVMACLRARVSPSRPAVSIWSQDLYTRGVSELSRERRAMVRLARALEGSALRRADSVIAIDERFRSFMCGELGVRPELVHVHRNWMHLGENLPVEPPERVRRRLGWRGTVALHAGSMGEKQGLEHLVEAARIAQQVGSDITFVLMGHGSRRPQVEELAAGCPNVVVMDPVPTSDFSATLRAADVLLVCERPGVREMALPSKLTSYFMAGKPVVASTHPTGTAAALIGKAEAGRLVAPGDPAAIFEAVKALSDDPVLAQVHGASGWTTSSSHRCLSRRRRWPSPPSLNGRLCAGSSARTSPRRTTAGDAESRATVGLIGTSRPSPIITCTASSASTRPSSQQTTSTSCSICGARPSRTR